MRNQIYALWAGSGENVRRVYAVTPLAGELQPVRTVQGAVMAAANTPAGMVRELVPWAWGMVDNWPKPARNELCAKLAEWQAVLPRGSQVQYEVPLGETGVTLPVIFQFGS